jgi:acyl-CoA thioester hydrolase
MTTIDLSSPPAGTFPYRSEIHYDELDGQMLLHHPRYLIHVERAQQAWFEHLLGASRFDWRNHPDMFHVVRRIEIDYLRPVDGVFPVVVLLWCRRLRAAALETGFLLAAADDGRVFARGCRTNCRISMEDRQAVMWSERFRERMRPWAEASPQGPAFSG